MTNDPRNPPTWPERLDPGELLHVERAAHLQAKSEALRKSLEGRYEPGPPLKLPDHPKPWAVAGYSARTLRSVMETDYGARKRQGDMHWTLPDGTQVRHIGAPHDMHTRERHTLFVLRGPTSAEFRRVMDAAWLFKWPVVDLPDGRGRGTV